MIRSEYMYLEGRLRFSCTLNVLSSAGKLQTPYCHLSNFIYCGSAPLSLLQIRLKNIIIDTLHSKPFPQIPRQSEVR